MSALYDKGREKFLTGSISWTSDTIKLVLVDTDVYTVNLGTHEFLSDIPLGARIATSGAFTGKTATNGVADAEDVVLTSVTGAESEALVIFKDTTDASTSPLIAFIDVATGLPITPNGANINVTWSDGANKIFKL